MNPLVLLVDDEPLIRGFFRKSLSGWLRIAEAGNGEEALAQVHIEPPVLVVMDLEMPVMDGLVAASEMRKIPGMERVPLIALTGYPGDDVIARARQCGFTYFVRKDVDARIFVDKVVELARQATAP